MHDFGKMGFLLRGLEKYLRSIRLGWNFDLS